MSKIPHISIVITTFNEEDYIRRCLDSLIDDFVTENAEILVADGRSEDRTRKIIESYQEKYPDLAIKIIDNPQRHQAHGLNKAIEQARGEVIVWIGAHAFYPSNYVEKCVRLLEETGADNVGGAIVSRGSTRFQKIVARAMQHPIGVGDSKFRLGGYKGFVDTVFPGTFRKKTFERLGRFDRYTNQDAEFNLRILKGGGKIYMDGSIEIEYYPRNALSGLIKQYFNYGKGRCRTTLKHKQFTSLRQLAPIFLVLGLIGSLVLSFIKPIFLLFPSSYIVSILGVSFWALRKEKRRFGDAFILAAIFMSMHISWGAGFLAKFFRLVR